MSSSQQPPWPRYDPGQMGQPGYPMGQPGYPMGQPGYQPVPPGYAPGQYPAPVPRPGGVGPGTPSAPSLWAAGPLTPGPYGQAVLAYNQPAGHRSNGAVRVLRPVLLVLGVVLVLGGLFSGLFAFSIIGVVLLIMVGVLVRAQSHRGRRRT